HALNTNCMGFVLLPPDVEDCAIAAVTATSRLAKNPSCVTPRRMTGRFPDIELVIPGSFTLRRELSAAAASRSSNCGQPCVCHLTAPNDRAHRLATATIPIITLALIGRVFVMAVSEYGLSRMSSRLPGRHR